MLRITAKLDRIGISSISAEGHTGFAESGSDIVCAAVSSLMQALWIGLEDVLEVHGVTVKSNPEIPLMSLTWKNSVKNTKNDEIQAIAKTVYIALGSIAKEYPDHVTIDEIDEARGG